MKMAKASERDIDAAGDAMSVLNDISSGYYPSRNGEQDAPTFFDPDDRDHLRLFYDLINATLDAAPGWPGRVIGGMCYVILYHKNEIVDPDSDVLELHPRFAFAAEENEWHPLLSAPTDGTEIELMIRHSNWGVAGKDRDNWQAIVRAKWIDFNGGGWTWQGMAGIPIGWRPISMLALNGAETGSKPTRPVPPQ